jgi:hypothetical protein
LSARFALRATLVSTALASPGAFQHACFAGFQLLGVAA